MALIRRRLLGHHKGRSIKERRLWLDSGKMALTRWRLSGRHKRGLASCETLGKVVKSKIKPVLQFCHNADKMATLKQEENC